MLKRRVSDLMNPDVVCASPDMTAGEVETLLALRGVSGAPVVDGDGRILGVVSQNDLIRHVSTPATVEETGRFHTDVDEYRDLGSLQADHSETPITEIMTEHAYTVGREASAAVAANIMRERRIHRLLVVEKGRLVGVVTSLDLMRIVEEVC
jgi:CBS domain-containing protein